MNSFLPKVDIETLSRINDYIDDKFGPCGHAQLEGDFTEKRVVHTLATIYRDNPMWRGMMLADPNLGFNYHMTSTELRARVLALKVRRRTMRMYWDSLMALDPRALPVPHFQEMVRDPVCLEILWNDAQQFQQQRKLPSAVVAFGYLPSSGEQSTSLYCPPNLPYDFVLGKVQEQARLAQATSN